MCLFIWLLKGQWDEGWLVWLWPAVVCRSQNVRNKSQVIRNLLKVLIVTDQLN